MKLSNIKSRKWFGGLFAILFGVLSISVIHAQIIGVQFVQAGPALGSSDTAGVIPQDDFNLVDVNNSSGTSGTTGFLLNSNGDTTAITLTHVSNDGYNSNTDTTTANGILLHGEDKTGPAGGGPSSGPGLTSSYTFNDVPDGTYNLIAYIENDIPGVNANITVGSNTEYVIEESATGTPSFTNANNTDPANRVTGNYVEFFNVSPLDNEISITNTSVGGGNDTASFNGFQLQTVPEPSTWALLLSGLGVLGFWRVRTRKIAP